MASIAFPKISSKVQLPNGTTYGFVHIKPSSNKPYVLLLHGFPSSCYDWRHQIDYLGKEGYGVIAPDLLGYGDTDKPTHPESYKLKKMAEETAALLDSLQIDEVIGVSHDWGSALLSRLANYHPDRFLAYVFLDIGYQSPIDKLSIAQINDISTEKLGYPLFGYWDFFNSADAAKLMERDPECTNSSIYPADGMSWKENFCRFGAAREWYEGNNVGPLAPYFSSSEVAIHSRIFASENGGYGPPLNWYKCQIGGYNDEDNARIPKERAYLEQPTLLVTCSGDPVAPPDFMDGGTRPFAKNLEVKQVDTSHWLLLEKPDEVNDILEGFFESLNVK